MKTITALGFLMLLFFQGCGNRQETAQQLIFDMDKAIYLYTFAYHCIDQEYPNKPGSVLGDDSYLKPPRKEHPAFYGCFDWHSAVHGHWTMVSILKEFPDFPHSDSILEKLMTNITEDNISREVLFFDDEHNRTFQRTYGWAWFLKLAEALREWDAPEAQIMVESIRPLEELLSSRFIEFLDVLNYPIRVGEHTNTAFGMSFAYDYARKYNKELAAKIEEKALLYFMNDRNCPLDWEPGGFDFLSPCLQEALLMRKVLTGAEFKSWFDKFLPGFRKAPSKYLNPAVVTDASDGKLAHLDGLNFSRAWCLFEIGKALDDHLMTELAIEHFNFSYEKLNADEYMGSHWLASFATYTLLTAGIAEKQ